MSVVKNHQKSSRKFVKKCLTNRDSGVIICKLSDERPERLEDGESAQKKLEKR